MPNIFGYSAVGNTRQVRQQAQEQEPERHPLSQGMPRDDFSNLLARYKAEGARFPMGDSPEAVAARSNPTLQAQWMEGTAKDMTAKIEGAPTSGSGAASYAEAPAMETHYKTGVGDDG